MVNTIFILDENKETSKILTINKQSRNIFWNDTYHQELSTGAETFEFTCYADEKIVEGANVIFYYNQQYKMFTIMELEQEHSEGQMLSNCYCETASMELTNQYVRNFSGDMNCIQFFLYILDNTGWRIGKYSSSLEGKVATIDVSRAQSVWSLIEDYKDIFECEINVRVTYENGRITGQLIDIYADGEMGTPTYKRFDYGRNVLGITKSKDLYDWATGLIVEVEGVEEVTFSRDNGDPFDKEVGDVILDPDNNIRYNAGRGYILGVYQGEEKDPRTACLDAWKELQKRAVPKFEYEVTTALTAEEYEDIHLGDTVYVIDYGYTPALFLEARVGELELSFTDRTQNKCVLTNYKEIKSRLFDTDYIKLTGTIKDVVNSFFPIGPDGIQDGAIVDGKIDTVYYKEITADIVSAGIGVFEDLYAQGLTVVNADIANLKAETAEVKTLKAQVAEINTLVNGHLTSDNIQSLILTSDKVTVADAFIKDAMISNISADKISTGTINTNNVNIQSADGSMTLNGSLQQFKDKDNKVRIQIGKDAQGNFTFALFSQDGVGVLIDETGIKEGAIGEGLIVDNMVAENANIQGGKLDINSVVTSINNGTTSINSSKVYLDDEGQSLKVAFDSLKTKVDTIEEVTITGDLSTIIEQVTSNTSSINIMQGEINSLIANTTITKANGEVVQLKDEYNSTKTTVDSHATKIGSLETNVNSVSSKQASLELNLNGFKTEVSDTYTTKDEFYDLEIGGRNLFSGGEIARSAPNRFLQVNIARAVELIVGKQITISFDMKLNMDGIARPITVYSYQQRGISIDSTASFTPSSNWERFSFVTNVKDWGNPTSDNPGSLGFYDYEGDNSYAIRKIKIELGNKATDYTPTPEEVQSQITEVSDKYSSLEQDVDGFKATVASTYTTKTEFDGLSFGGTNILENSNCSEGTTYWYGSDGSRFEIVPRTMPSVAPPAGIEKCFKATSGDGKTSAAICQTVTTLRTSTQYTASAWLYGPSVVPRITIYEINNGVWTEIKSVVMSSYNYWHRAILTFTTKATAPNGGYAITFGIANTVSGKGVYCCLPKLEEGNRATAWSPSTRDIQGQIDINNANIDVVSEKYSSLEQDLGRFKTTVTDNYVVNTQLYTVDDKATAAQNAANNAVNTANSASSTANNALNKANINATNLTTISSKQSSLEQTVNDFTMTVSKTYATKDELADYPTMGEISEVYTTKTEFEQTAENFSFTVNQTGGTNLLRNSNFYDKGAEHWHFSNCSQFTTDMSETYYPDGQMCIMNRAVGTSGTMYQWDVPVTPNTIYTFSTKIWWNMYVAGVGINIDFRGSGSDTVVKSLWYTPDSNTWLKRYAWTFTTPSNVTRCSVSFVHEGTTGGQTSEYLVMVQHPCLQRGYSGEWTPHSGETRDGIVKIDRDGITVKQGTSSAVLDSEALKFFDNGVRYSQINGGQFRFTNSAGKQVGSIGRTHWVNSTKFLSAINADYGNLSAIGAQREQGGAYIAGVWVAGQDAYIANTGSYAYAGFNSGPQFIAGSLYLRANIDIPMEVFDGVILPPLFLSGEQTNEGFAGIVCGEDVLNLGVLDDDSIMTGLKLVGDNSAINKVSMSAYANLHMNGFTIYNAHMTNAMSARTTHTQGLLSRGSIENTNYSAMSYSANEIRWCWKETVFTYPEADIDPVTDEWVYTGRNICYIELPIFMAESIQEDYHIQIGKIGWGDYRVIEKTPYYFILESQEEDFAFTFEIVATLLDGQTLDNNAIVANYGIDDTEEALRKAQEKPGGLTVPQLK